MSWLRERELFLHTMASQGMALDDIRRVLRAAQKWAQGGSGGVKIEGFVILWAPDNTTTIRKETGTAWYRVPTRS